MWKATLEVLFFLMVISFNWHWALVVLIILLLPIGIPALFGGLIAATASPDKKEE